MPRHVLATLAALTGLLPVLASAETRAVRFDGNCNLTRHDSLQTALEVTAKGKMRYTARINSHRFVTGDWMINPLLFIANPTDEELYCHYYIAFFDKDGTLVGCCNQGSDVDPGSERFQLGSCLIYGTKSRLLSAARYQAVIYESDRPVGEEPVSAQDVPEDVARTGKTVAVLSDLTVNHHEEEGLTTASLKCGFAAVSADAKPPRVSVRPKKKLRYNLTVASQLRTNVVTRTADGKRTKTELTRWQTDLEVERYPRPKTTHPRYHAALLDEKGNLLVCSTYTGGRWLYAPADFAMKASKLLLTVYELPKD